MCVGSPEGKGGEHDSSFLQLLLCSLSLETASMMTKCDLRGGAHLLFGLLAIWLARNSAQLILLLYTTLTICTHEKKVSDPKYFDIIVIKYLL